MIIGTKRRRRSDRTGSGTCSNSLSSNNSPKFVSKLREAQESAIDHIDVHFKESVDSDVTKNSKY